MYKSSSIVYIVHPTTNGNIYKPFAGKSFQISVNEVREGEVSLMSEVVLQVRGGDLGAVLSERLQRHELHHSLGQVAHQPLL